VNKSRRTLHILMQLSSLCLIALIVTSAFAQVPSSTQTKNGRIDSRNSLAVATNFSLSVAPWESSRMSDSGTPTASRSTASDSIVGMIKTTLGGLKFPDGTVQAGKSSPPVPGGPLFVVTHDETLQGDGTKGSPLGITVPLLLNGSLTVTGIITASPDAGNAVEATGGVDSRGNGAIGVNANGGKGGAGNGGTGIVTRGGDSTGSLGGGGLIGEGGNAVIGSGGIGVKGDGGASDNNRGGTGVLAIGGHSRSFIGGTGVEVVGGSSDNERGGTGLDVTGGSASGNSNVVGTGIVARAGTAFNGADKGLAGDFVGDVLVDLGDLRVTGNLSKGGGSFKIDHPLDPANKYLYHSFVESPDMMNIYNGIVTTDGTGDAVVELPSYFGALNRDFRYQLTVIGTFAQAVIADKVNNNRFRIKTNAPNVEVSWQVTGIRQDAYANKNRIPVEQDKPQQERGFFLHPDAFNQPEERSVFSVQHPDLARKMKEEKEKSQKEQNQ
jgi:hypothetical protein